MTAADEARAEAARRYQPSKLIEDYNGDRYVDDEWGYDECQRNAFVAGAEWQASNPITDEQVEVAAKAVFAVAPLIHNAGDWVAKDWDADWLDEATRDIWRSYARAALDAALAVQA